MRGLRQGLLLWWVGLAACLALAYWASLPRSEKNDGKVAIVKLDVSAVDRVELKSAALSVAASRREDYPERWWVSIHRAPETARSGGVTPSPVDERFMASERFNDMLAMLAPFQALRVIGAVPEALLGDYGLSQGAKTLTVTGKGGNLLLALLIGKPMYGSRDVYVMNQADQSVMLVSGDLVSDFEKLELRVYERAIMGFSLDDAQSAEVSTSGKSRSFAHTKRDAKGGLIWTVDGADGEQVSEVSSWFDRFDKLKGAMYADPEGQARLASMPPLVRIKLAGPGTASEEIQIRRLVNGATEEYWLTSGYLRWHVKVAATRADSLIKDVPLILGRQESPRP